MLKRIADFSEIQNYLRDMQQEAIVQCLTDIYGEDSGLLKKRYYKSIAASENNGGSYLVIDDNMCCWVPKEFFKPVFDPFGVLTHNN